MKPIAAWLLTFSRAGVSVLVLSLSCSHWLVVIYPFVVIGPENLRYLLNN